MEDLDNPSYFWRAHTVTVLLGLIGCLVYTSLIGIVHYRHSPLYILYTEAPVEDAGHNGKRGFAVALFFWVTLGKVTFSESHWIGLKFTKHCLVFECYK